MDEIKWPPGTEFWMVRTTNPRSGGIAREPAIRHGHVKGGGDYFAIVKWDGDLKETRVAWHHLQDNVHLTWAAALEAAVAYLEREAKHARQLQEDAEAAVYGLRSALQSQVVA